MEIQSIVIPNYTSKDLYGRNFKRALRRAQSGKAVLSDNIYSSDSEKFIGGEHESEKHSNSKQEGGEASVTNVPKTVDSIAKPTETTPGGTDGTTPVGTTPAGTTPAVTTPAEVILQMGGIGRLENMETELMKVGEKLDYLCELLEFDTNHGGKPLKHIGEGNAVKPDGNAVKQEGGDSRRPGDEHRRSGRDEGRRYEGGYDGGYDGGRHDRGRHSSGRHDSGRHDSGRHEGGRDGHQKSHRRSKSTRKKCESTTPIQDGGVYKINGDSSQSQYRYSSSQNGGDSSQNIAPYSEGDDYHVSSVDTDMLRKMFDNSPTVSFSMHASELPYNKPHSSSRTAAGGSSVHSGGSSVYSGGSSAHSGGSSVHSGSPYSDSDGSHYSDGYKSQTRESDRSRSSYPNDHSPYNTYYAGGGGHYGSAMNDSYPYRDDSASFRASPYYTAED